MGKAPGENEVRTVIGPFPTGRGREGEISGRYSFILEKISLVLRRILLGVVGILSFLRENKFFRWIRGIDEDYINSVQLIDVINIGRPCPSNRYSYLERFSLNHFIRIN